MNILFLTLCDFKDLDERWIYTDLMKMFVANGHSISIVSPRERKFKEKTNLISSDNCKILKVEIGNTQKTNIFERGLTTILLQHQILSAIKEYLHEEVFDLILYSTPPVTFAKVISYFRKNGKVTTYLMLKDIFPQNAVDIGLLRRGGVIYHYFRRKEELLYSLSDYIGCMSEANVKYLLNNNPYIFSDRVEVCPNSIIPNDYISIDKTFIRKKFNLPLDSVLFIYGGNFGKPQSVDYIIKVLNDNRDKEDRFFVMCGTGTELYKFENYLNNERPKNVLLMHGLPKNEYDKLLSACDIGLVFLDSRYTIPNFPSRILPYMEYNLPVIAATDSCTDIGKIIVNGNFGWWCESKVPKDFTEIVDEICSNQELIPLKGQNARSYLESHFTAKHSYDIIMNHFKD